MAAGAGDWAWLGDGQNVWIPDVKIEEMHPMDVLHPVRGAAYTLAVEGPDGRIVGWMPIEATGYASVRDWMAAGQDMHGAAEVAKRRPYEDLDRAIWNLAGRAADDAFALWKYGPRRAYLYFLPGRLDLKVVPEEGEPEAPWEIVTGEPLPLDRDRRQMVVWIRDRVRSIPLLPTDEVDLDARIGDLLAT